jgi:hypothetical protein
MPIKEVRLEFGKKGENIGPGPVPPRPPPQIHIDGGRNVLLARGWYLELVGHRHPDRLRRAAAG